MTHNVWTLMITARFVRLVTVSMFLCIMASAQGADDVALGGAWTIRLDVEDRGRSADWQLPDHSVWSSPPPTNQRSETVPVPGAMEATLGPYDGVSWLRTEFVAPSTAIDGRRWMLAFDNANDRVDVWWNGEHVGRHAGSDIAFQFDVEQLVVRDAGRPVALTVRCVDPGTRPIDNLELMARPHAKESWYYNYGGLIGDVALRSVPVIDVTSVDAWLDENDVPHADVFLDDHRASPAAIDVHVTLGQAAANQTATSTAPHARLALPIAASLSRWSPDAPHRHELTVTVTSGNVEHTTTHLVGLRRFAVHGTHFTLNGEVVRLLGVLYQPLHPRGLANPPDDTWIRREMEAIKAAGFDMVRAHIRVMPEVYEICDEIGLLVHAEPTLGWVRRERANTWPAVDAALVAGAEAFRGHPSVVMVGMLNELSGVLHTRVGELHDRFASLLPHHVVLDDSGSWRGSAHYRNPEDAARVSFVDKHLYRAWPWSKKDFDDTAALGFDVASARDGLDTFKSNEQLIYVSEYGFGGLPNFSSAAHFTGETWRHDGGDAIEIARAAAEGLTSTPVGSVAASIDELAALGAKNQARAAEVMTRALLANERVAALVYTQWRDVAWECGAGLVDTWGKPKAALDVFATLDRESPDAQQREEPARLAPPSTDPVARVRWIGVSDELRSVLEPHTQALDTPAGGIPEVAVVGARVAGWGPDNIDDTIALWRWVAEGGVAWLVRPEGQAGGELIFGYDGFGQVAELPFAGRMSPARGHFIGTHHIAHEGSPLLAGIPTSSRMLDEQLAPSAPHQVLAIEGVPGVQAGLVTVDGYGLYLGSAMQVVPFERGAVVLTTLRLDETALAHAPSRQLLANTLGAVAQVAAAQGRPAPAWDPPAPVAPQLAKRVGRAVWRHRVFFGLAERLAVQRLDGRRTLRRDLDDLDRIVARKNAGLRLVVAGDLAGGLARLDAIDDHFTMPVEMFMRRERELTRELYRPKEDSTPLALADTVAVAHAHAVALALMRAEAHDAAMIQLDSAFKELAAARSEPETGDQP